MAAPTWEQRELKILEAIAQLELDDKDRVDHGTLMRMTGLTEPEARQGLTALSEGGYIRHGSRAGSRGSWIIFMPRLSAMGRRAVGQWPPESLDAILRVLEARIQAEQDPERRSKLEKVRDAIGQLSYDVLKGVLIDWARQLPNVLGGP